MNYYKHLTIDERERIMFLLNSGKNKFQIAKILGRHHTTIGREVERNKPPKNYSASRAQKRYENKKKNCGAIPILKDPYVRNFVEEHLKLRWRAEEISAWVKKEKLPFKISPSTIYRGYDTKLISHSLKQYFPQKKKNKRHKKESRQGKMQDTVSIHKRPKIVDERKRIGDFEGDTVIGQRKTGSMLTFVDRASMYLIVGYIENRNKELVKQQTVELLKNNKVKTMTLDNGKEFQNHKEIEKQLKIKIYFCDPYSPWQRGLNEYMNRTLREYFPKKINFAILTKEEIEKAVNEINNRPRKRLNYYTPNQVFHNPRLLRKMCT